METFYFHAKKWKRYIWMLSYLNSKDKFNCTTSNHSMYSTFLFKSQILHKFLKD